MTENKTEATTEDLDKVMQLLTEYTDKLRAICEEKEESRFRRLQMMSMSMIVLMSVLMSVMFLIMREGFGSQSQSFTLPLLILVGGVTFAAFFFLTTTMSSRRLRYSFQAKQIALTVEKLISLASQYSEHSTRKIADKFEFDLRVAEAEAALHMYEEVFSRHDGEPRKDR